LENIAIWISIYFLLDFLDNLGKKIVIMDLATNLAGLTCLVVPVIFYHVYTRDNPLARLWVKYMRVDSDVYFSFMVPAVIAMALAFRIPLGRLDFNKSPSKYIDNVKLILQQKSSLGLILIGTGFVSGLLDFLAPESLQQVFYFLAHLTYVGAFYVIYSPNKRKKTIVPLVLLLMILQTLATGMFGDFVLMLVCSLVLIMVGKNIPFYKKFLVMIAGLFFILILQSVKSDYRKRVWGSGGGADPTYYASLVTERITNPSTILDPEKLFFVGVRMNQGWLIANTMYYVPAKYDFAHGETIWQSIAASIVPRFLWPDKPEAGGKANLLRFWGATITGFSMNIGPFGEGYANYDVTGGIVFMFFYGLFFNLILSYLIKLAEKRPTLILWIPFLFFYAIGVETDLLTTMGSLLKGLVFTWLIFKVFKIAFRIDL
jgi:hypothetical protein